MVISVQNITKRYQSVALQGVSLEVKRGAIFGVIGMSGAGKTTLMRCLTALERPDEGRIVVAGEEISALEGARLRTARKKIGMIFQHFNLFSARTALQNVAYPLEIEGVGGIERRKQALEMLERVGLKEKANHYPAQLSGGEKQRVAIARALINDPEVLLCDEATSALDPRNTQAILELLASLDLTILLITHEMEVIKQICTHVAVLEHGEVVEQGEVAALFAHPKHPTTQRFLQSLPHEEVPQVAGTLLRLTFTGEAASQPIISRLVREHAVEVNILRGGIDVLREATVGNLVVELSGESEARAAARAFLEEQGVKCHELV